MKLAILLTVLHVLGPKHTENAVKVANAVIEESKAAPVSVDPLLVTAITGVESHFDAKAINTDGKCIGLMQVRIGSSSVFTRRQLQDPRVNVREGIRILQEKIRQCGTLPRALAAYNNGACVPKGKAAKRVRNYVTAVLESYDHLQTQVKF